MHFGYAVGMCQVCPEHSPPELTPLLRLLPGRPSPFLLLNFSSSFKDCPPHVSALLTPSPTHKVVCPLPSRELCPSVWGVLASGSCPLTVVCWSLKSQA